MNKPINRHKYQSYLEAYTREAIHGSDGSPGGIRAYLDSIQVRGAFVRDKNEKQRALADLIQAFTEHRHWPLEIILSHLGIQNP